MKSSMKVSLNELDMFLRSGEVRIYTVRMENLIDELLLSLARLDAWIAKDVQGFAVQEILDGSMKNVW